MKHLFLNRFFSGCLALLLGFGIWSVAPAALAVNAPELLPEQPTTVIDLAQSLTSSQEEGLDRHLEAFERETGWKLRVLTQFDRTPGRAVKDFWQLDDRSILLIEDSRAGNILNFSIGDAAYQILPRNFWLELQNRFGNQYFVRDNGEDQSILKALESVEICLQRDGCNVVPGISNEQWIMTLLASMLGGVICGFAAHPRHSEKNLSWKWVLILSPVWGLLLIAFGVAPVMTRTADLLPLVRNLSGFAIACLAAMLMTPKSTPTSEA